jgi:hypothetical protein
MIESEDSVVTSLNELRKLKNERIVRQTKSRPVSVGNRAAALAEDPLADQPTPLPVRAIAALAAHSSAPAANRFVVPASIEQAQALPVIQTKTSYKAAVLMTVLLVGAGAAGYMKLQQDTQALIATKEAAIKSSEDARMRSVEAAAKADALVKTNLRQCEDKLKASISAAAVPAVPAVAAIAPATLEKTPDKIVATKATRGGHRGAHAARQIAQAPAAREAREKSGDVPTIAKKKKVENDPLAGLGKL